MSVSECARAYLKVRFQHQGRYPWALDCVGLLVRAFRDAGRPLRDCTDYGRDPHDGLLERHLSEQLGPPVDDGPRADDVVSLRFFGATRHVGIIGVHPAGGLSLIHTSLSVGRVTEHRLDPKWVRRITGVYR